MSATNGTRGLALAGLIVLFANGSQSNHVILELLVTVAVLLTAPWGGRRNGHFNYGTTCPGVKAGRVIETGGRRSLVQVTWWPPPH